MSDLAKIKAANNKTLSVLKVLVLAVFRLLFPQSWCYFIALCIWQVENDEFGNEKMQSLPSR